MAVLHFSPLFFLSLSLVLLVQRRERERCFSVADATSRIVCRQRDERVYIPVRSPAVLKADQISCETSVAGRLSPFFDRRFREATSVA